MLGALRGIGENDAILKFYQQKSTVCFQIINFVLTFFKKNAKFKLKLI